MNVLRFAHSLAASLARIPQRAPATRRVLYGLAALPLLPLLPAHTVRAVVPHNRVADNPVPPACSWRTVSSVADGSVALYDPAVTAWTTFYYAHRGLLLHLTGDYPRALYLSFAVHPARIADDGSISVDRSTGSYLPDVQIRPDSGSINPFLSASERSSSQSRQHYNIWIGLQPSRSYRNFMAAAADQSSNLGALTYRIYAPDHGSNRQGGVDLPHIDKIAVAGDGSKATVISVPLCSPPTRVTGTALFQNLTVALEGQPLTQWRHMTATGSSSAREDEDGAALMARLRPSSALTVIHFKAPTVPSSGSGAAKQTAQVRFWSFCAYSLDSGTPNGCISAAQSAVDRRGYVTVVLGTAAHRPASAALHGASWVPFNGSQGVLVYRQLVASRSFAQAITHVAANTSNALQSGMGAYYPALVTCSTSRWVSSRCGLGGS